MCYVPVELILGLAKKDEEEEEEEEESEEESEEEEEEEEGGVSEVSIFKIFILVFNSSNVMLMGALQMTVYTYTQSENGNTGSLTLVI